MVTKNLKIDQMKGDTHVTTLIEYKCFNCKSIWKGDKSQKFFYVVDTQSILDLIEVLRIHLIKDNPITSDNIK